MLLISKSGHSGRSAWHGLMFLLRWYFNKMNILPSQPEADFRDYFFLSIGHIAPVWYATLSRRGYFPID